MLEKDKNDILRRVMAETNISQSSMSRYLNERKNKKSHMPARVLEAFAAQLNLPMEDLLNK